MAHASMPDEFCDIIVHHLPPEEPVGPAGGRPAIGHYDALRVIVGCRSPLARGS